MKKLSIIEMISISWEWGGIEQHVQDVAAGLTSRGHNVRVVCREFEMYKRKYGEVCPVHVLPIRNSIDIKTIRGLAHLITEHKADVVHVHTSRDAWLGLFATKIAGRGKVAVTKHGPFHAKRDPVHTWFYNQLGAIICVSDFVRNNFLGDNPLIKTDHVHLIYPGIHTGKFDQVYAKREQLGEKAKPFTVGFAGRVTVEKGVHILLKAIAELKKLNIDAQAIIVGAVNPNTPEFMDELQSLVKREGITDNVTFYGFSDNVAAVMSDFDVLVLPSIIPEASPLVLREAALAGLTAIGTTLGGQEEIIQEGVTGFLVQPESPTDLAAILGRLALNPQLAQSIGQQARDYAVSNFSIDVMLDKLEKRFYNLIHE